MVAANVGRELTTMGYSPNEAIRRLICGLGIAILHLQEGHSVVFLRHRTAPFGCVDDIRCRIPQRRITGILDCGIEILDSS